MNSILPVNLTDSEEKKAGGWARRANRNIFSGWAGSERHSSTSCSEWCRVLIRWATCEVIQRKICSVSTRLPLYSLSMTLPFDAEVWGTDMIRVERCQPRLMHDLAHRRHNQQWSTAGQIYMQFHLSHWNRSALWPHCCSTTYQRCYTVRRSCAAVWQRVCVWTCSGLHPVPVVRVGLPTAHVTHHKDRDSNISSLSGSSESKELQLVLV